MKIQIVSDLHLESYKGEHKTLWTGVLPAVDAEILVIAGDIDSGIGAVERFQAWPIPVVYIAGNHEFYAMRDLDMTARALRAACRGTRVHFLENEALVIDRPGGLPPVRFLGATMWTDYLLFGGPEQAACMMACANTLPDHARIRRHDKTFLPRDARDRHLASKAWLQKQFASRFDGQTVVVTHHGCHWNSVGPRWRTDLVSAGFSSDLTGLLGNADLWIHGHCHESFDYHVGRCRVVVNPRGYPMRHGGYENADFNSQKVVDLALQRFHPYRTRP